MYVLYTYVQVCVCVVCMYIKYTWKCTKMSKQSEMRKHLFDGFLKFTYNPVM